MALAAACSAHPKLVPIGGDCLQATDCEFGLVCVPQKDKSRICTNDLSAVQKTEEAAPPPRIDAGRDGGDAGDAGDGGGQEDAQAPSDASDASDAGTD